MTTRHSYPYTPIPINPYPYTPTPNHTGKGYFVIRLQPAEAMPILVEYHACTTNEKGEVALTLTLTLTRIRIRILYIALALTLTVALALTRPQPQPLPSRNLVRHHNDKGAGRALGVHGKGYGREGGHRSPPPPASLPYFPTL